MKNWRFLILIALVPLLALMSSCSSDDGTTPEEDDTTAPLVTQVDPVQNETDVAVDEDVTITFNEDMDPATANGNVSLSVGTITDLDWPDANTLEIEHADWPEGTEVTVNVGTGLTDEAGNALANAFSWSFWTFTSDVILLNTLPIDGATAVPLNSQIYLEFSQSMDEATLPGAITVTSPDKVTHTYTLAGEYEDWTLTLDANLPATTLITVTITTDAQANGGTPLAAETALSFTTGAVVDNTPPNLIGIEPANGTIIPVDTSFLRLTFDEPIDDMSLQPSMVSGQLMMSMGNPENAGVWTNGNTVFTVALVTPLAPGAILAVDFDTYADMHGNVQTTPFEWSVTVTGTAEHFPVYDELLMFFYGTWSNDIKDSGEMQALTYIDIKTGGEFWRHEVHSGYGPYKDLGINWDLEDYDRFMQTGSSIQYLGFYEFESGGGKAADMDITFSPTFDWIRMPIVANDTWSGTASFVPTPLDGPTSVDYTFTVAAATEDIESPGWGDKAQEDSPPIFWLDCWKVSLVYTLMEDEVEYMTGQDEFWYAPGVGLVKKTSMESGGVESMSSVLHLVWAGLEADFPDY
jgi:hypothetical protein